MESFNVLLFDNFETLDAFGPVEIIGKLDKVYRIAYVSRNGGIITSSHAAGIETIPFGEMDASGVLLIPGGFGTRSLVTDEGYLRELEGLAGQASFVLTVCTGSGLLAKTGYMKDKRATSNKQAFDWASAQDPAVDWQRRARWTHDGNLYTASGVSAGMDMTLGFVWDQVGEKAAELIAHAIEYIWNKNPDNDPFILES